MSYRPTTLSAKQLAAAARAGREDALQERELAELTRQESVDTNGGAIISSQTTGYFPPEPSF